jgi:hypothetical protein
MIHFDEATHIYRVNGEVKRSVTQILKDVGIINYDGVPDYYRDRGTAIHRGCELLAQGYLDWSTVHEDYLPCLKRFEVFMKDYEYVSSEQVLYCPTMDYCGTFDLLVRDKKSGDISIVDIKTSKTPADWWGLQLAAYAYAADFEYQSLKVFSLGNNAIYRDGKQWAANMATWEQIIDGTFNLAAWKSNRTRRNMVKE